MQSRRFNMLILYINKLNVRSSCNTILNTDYKIIYQLEQHCNVNPSNIHFTF